MPVVNVKKAVIAPEGIYRLKFDKCEVFPKEAGDCSKFHMEEQAYSWQFTVVDGPYAGLEVPGMSPLEATSANKTGRWIANLNNGGVPEGVDFEINHLKGKECMGHLKPRTNGVGVTRNSVKDTFPLAGLVQTPQISPVPAAPVADPVAQPAAVQAPAPVPEPGPTAPVAQPAPVPATVTEPVGQSKPRKLQM